MEDLAVTAENVLWDIRDARGLEQRATGTLKKLRTRWFKRLEEGA